MCHRCQTSRALHRPRIAISTTARRRSALTFRRERLCRSTWEARAANTGTVGPRPSRGTRARSLEVKRRSAAGFRSWRSGGEAGVGGVILLGRFAGADAPNWCGASCGTGDRGTAGRGGAGTCARSAGRGGFRERRTRTSRSSSGITMRNATSSSDSIDMGVPDPVVAIRRLLYRIGGFGPLASPWSAIASRIDESAWMFCIR